MTLFETFKKELPDVTGKVFVITGTTSGTGYIAARTVAEFGGEVLLLNRPTSRSESSLAKLKEDVPDGKFVPIDCDLQDFNSVKKAADYIISKYDKIYCLANNAGIWDRIDKKTMDGYDITIQTNHLSHFLLTRKLFPLLIAGAEHHSESRIIQHSSGAREMTTDNRLEKKYFEKDRDDLGGDSETFMDMKGPNMQRYAQSKLANSLFMYALDEKVKSSKDESTRKIRSIAAHPGAAKTRITREEMIGDDLPNKKSFILKMLLPFFQKFVFQSADDGAMGLIKGMMHADAQSGTLYGPKRVSGNAEVIPPESYETNVESKEMLWKVSEEAAGLDFII